jgi:hypothetical protein
MRPVGFYAREDAPHRQRKRALIVINCLGGFISLYPARDGGIDGGLRNGDFTCTVGTISG